jgi:hypothetical protein
VGITLQIKSIKMADNYTSNDDGKPMGGRFFKISFVVFQLLFSGFLMFYVFRKSEMGANLLGSIFP